MPKESKVSHLHLHVIRRAQRMLECLSSQERVHIRSFTVSHGGVSCEDTALHLLSVPFALSLGISVISKVNEGARLAFLLKFVAI